MFKFNLTQDSEKILALKNLVTLTASHSEEGRKAREAIANFVGPVITQVLNQAATHRMFFTTHTYDFDGVPSIPLDLYEGNEEGLIDIWSSSIAGGLATNHVSGGDDFRLTTWKYDTALSMLVRNAKEGRFELLVKSIERAAQEVMVKEKFHAWNCILRALGAARTNGEAQLVDATTQNVFQLDDINNLKTKVARYRNSWLGGTPTETVGEGFTHLVVSPEIMAQVRAWAYQPMNTRPGSFTSSGATAIALPDQVRMNIFNQSGLPEIAGVGAFIQLNEMGVDQPYNAVFDSGYTAGGGDVGFDSTQDELVLAIDMSVEAGARAVATNSDRSSEFQFFDDEFHKRSEKIGYYGFQEIGYGWFDSKALSGIVV